MKRFLATDLDGTFLNPKKRYNRDYFAKVLQAYENAGGHFIVASGRDWQMAGQLFAGFEGRFDLVVDNGATIMTGDGQYTELRAVEPAGLQTLMAEIDAMPTAPHGGVLFFGHDHLYAVRPYDNVESDFLVHTEPQYGPTLVVDDVRDIPEPILKATAFYGEAASLELVARLDKYPDLHGTTPGMGVVDIMAGGVNKASGLEKLLAHYGADMSDLVVFGDGMNDFEMMQAAGQAVVMPNGDDKLKQHGFGLAVADNAHDGMLKTWEQMI